MNHIAVEYGVSCVPEDMSPIGNVLASGDEEQDAAAAADVLRQLDAGNEWAWCTVMVVARVESGGYAFEGHDYLGGCSYASKADFLECGYYNDMKADALRDLQSVLRHAAEHGECAFEILASLA